MSLIKLTNLPLKVIQVTSHFGMREITVNGRYYWWHNGIDLKATEGTEVYSVADGLVKIVGDNPTGYGTYVMIDYGNYSALFAHLSKTNVKVNELVKGGQLIGYSGNTGVSTAPHLHFEIRECEYKNAWDRCKTDPNVFMRCVDPLPYIENCIQRNNLTKIDAQQILIQKIGFDENTMNYLNYYRYGTDLIIKIGKATL